MKRLILAGILSAALLLAADITGKWNAEVETDMGSGTPVFEFNQTGEQLSGTYKGTFGEQKLTGTVKGDDVEWSFDNEQAGKVSYKGKLDGASKMKGTAIYGALGSGTFTASR